MREATAPPYKQQSLAAEQAWGDLAYWWALKSAIGVTIGHRKESNRSAGSHSAKELTLALQGAEVD